jgi:hypothetical protein
MTPLNIESTEVFIKLIGLADQSEGYVKIKNNDDFMPVVFERLESFLFGYHKAISYSLAHYGTLNGDLMADPEMTFIFLPDLQKVYPSSFTNHYAGTYRESLFWDNDKWMINKNEQADEALFADDWMMNIKRQQKL